MTISHLNGLARILGWVTVRQCCPICKQTSETGCQCWTPLIEAMSRVATLQAADALAEAVRPLAALQGEMDGLDDDFCITLVWKNGRAIAEALVGDIRTAAATLAAYDAAKKGDSNG